MSNTHARQSRFSMTEMESGGKPERSSGWTAPPRFDFSAAELRTGDFFTRSGFAARLPLAGSCKSLADCLTGLGVDFGFRVGMVSLRDSKDPGETRPPSAVIGEVH